MVHSCHFKLFNILTQRLNFKTLFSHNFLFGGINVEVGEEFGFGQIHKNFVKPYKCCYIEGVFICEHPVM